MTQRRRHRPLGARLDLERAQRQPLAALGQRPGRRRQPLAFVQRAPQRGRARLGDPRLFGELLSDPFDHRLPEPRKEFSGRLATQLEPLPAAPQPVERRGGAFATPRNRRELLFGPLALP